MMEPTQYAGDEISLQQYIEIFRRRRWAILGTILLIFGAGCVVTSLMKPVYEAKAKLIVQTSAPPVRSVHADSSLMDLLDVAQPEPLNTQIEILQSEPFLKEVYAASRVPAGVPADIHASGDPDTNIVTVRVQSTDPKAAAHVANTVLDEYLESTRVLSLQEVIRARQFVERQTAKAQQALQRTEAAVANFRRTSGLDELTTEKKKEIEDLFQLEAQSRQSESDLLRLQAQMREVQSQLARQPREREVVISQENPRIAILRAKLADTTTERDTLLQSFRPGSQKVRAIESQIASLQSQLSAEPSEMQTPRREPNARREQLVELLDTYQAELQGIRAQRTQVDARLREQRLRMKRDEPGPAEARLAQLQRDRDAAERSYLLLSSRLQDLEIRENAQRSTARIFAHAGTPRSPIRPRPEQNLALALALGILLSGCVAFVLEFLDDRITSPEAVERLLGLPVLGYIPAIASEQRLMNALPPYSPPAESYRGLRPMPSWPRRSPLSTRSPMSASGSERMWWRWRAASGWTRGSAAPSSMRESAGAAPASPRTWPRWPTPPASTATKRGCWK